MVSMLKPRQHVPQHAGICESTPLPSRSCCLNCAVRFKIRDSVELSRRLDGRKISWPIGTEPKLFEHIVGRHRRRELPERYVAGQKRF